MARGSAALTLPSLHRAHSYIVVDTRSAVSADHIAT